MPRAESRPNWSPLKHVPCDEVLARLIDTAERRWSADRFDNDHDIKALDDWLWDTTTARDDEAAAVSVIEAANSLGPRSPADCDRAYVAL